MLAYYSENRQVKKNWFGLKDFRLHTSGTTYPSDKLSLNIANLTKFKRMRWFNMFFQLNGKYDIEVLFEDSKRNSQHYININYINIFFSFTKRSIFHSHQQKGNLIRIDKNGYSLMIDYYVSMW